MLSLDKLTIELQCPNCGFYNTIFFKQARLRDIIICRGCKANVQLDDTMNECRKVERSFRKAVKGFEDSLSNFDIKINI